MNMENNINEKMLVNFIMQLNRLYPEMMIAEKFSNFSNDFKKFQKRNSELKKTFSIKK
jgi:hypothetical protein|tara:strand:- start:2286 stop:2459 length:174 start_codon:yes stop_codon:yes gene_type:complete